MEKDTKQNKPDAVDDAYKLKEYCKTQAVCTDCPFYLIGEDDAIQSCCVIEPQYWKLPKRNKVKARPSQSKWPDVQIELVVAKDLSHSLDHCKGKVREHAILDAKMAAILEAIAEFGSLNKAAQNLRISYSHAFALLDEIEKSFGFSFTNGFAGAGSTLTPKAEKLLAVYKKVSSESKEFLEQNYKEVIGSAK
jgi:molybdate transport repressor ModE-like protein